MNKIIVPTLLPKENALVTNKLTKKVRRYGNHKVRKDPDNHWRVLVDGALQEYGRRDPNAPQDEQFSILVSDIRECERAQAAKESADAWYVKRCEIMVLQKDRAKPTAAQFEKLMLEAQQVKLLGG